MRYLFVLLSFFIFSLAPSAAHAQQTIGINAGDQYLDATGHLMVGPHMDGNAYIALRQGADLNSMNFMLRIVDGEVVRVLNLSVGPDFVIERQAAQTVVYDFRFRRRMEFEAGSQTFLTQSLYALWHQRWAFLQNNLYVTSILHAASQLEKPSVERFFVEQQNGINHPQELAFNSLPKPVLLAKKKSDRLEILVDKTSVAEVEFSDSKFLSRSHTDTFAAWLVWSLNLHPDVASLLGSKKYLPNEINKTERRDMDKTNQVLFNLTDISSGGADFSFLASHNPQPPIWEPRISAVMADLMINAARGTAPNGPLSSDEYIIQLRQLQKTGQPLDIFLLGIHSSFGCERANPQPAICAVSLKAMTNVINDKDVKTLGQALGKDQAGEHAAAVRSMLALRSDQLQRVDILDIMIANTLVEGKNKNQLDEELEQKFQELPKLFESAFQADPYSPSRYRDYYNYLHASVDNTDDRYFVLTRAYPVIDIARSLPERAVPPLVEAITDIERLISRDFSSHFPEYAR